MDGGLRARRPADRCTCSRRPRSHRGRLQALFVDSASFLISALLVARLVRVAGQVVEQEVPEPYWKGLRAGLTFVLKDRLMRAIVAIVVVTNLFDAANSTVLLPVYAERELGGAVALGLLVGVTGGGASSARCCSASSAIACPAAPR